jgi:hypothetical protein
VISSVIPSAKYASSGGPRLSNGRTTIRDNAGSRYVSADLERWSQAAVAATMRIAAPAPNHSTRRCRGTETAWIDSGVGTACSVDIERRAKARSEAD